ncbi:IS1182 family transposase [Pseudomonas putida]|uniref:IS1182 family transposase n=1 Tax=Pseudomonas TaxID=286 RepID=UPI0003BB18BF|nr:MULTISPECIES: IS1182 family transposase [Pseudomonas]KYZ86090.1 hypothetical protein A3Q32_18885 [Alcanivorax sp. KX64203]CAH0066288.1 conserved protein of unknown function [Stenotrophomonas maltophilia]HEP0294009.1 IS1182 family transposase [Klebsiella aerogenes]EIU1333515.1 IS1182 family transposase [Pseudomonas aeruginosa]ERY89013.1 hypothetical protein Q021_04592 [Pseudomonas aeruginosa BWHPSA008]
MPRYKPQERNGLFLPVVLSEQIVPGSFAFALDYLVDHELDLSELDARFRNGETGASAYDPRVMLKIVLFAYSQGLLSSRAIERACLHNVQFIALSGNSQPSHAHIAKFVSQLGEQVKALFAQVLVTCDAQGLIGGELFAIDGVKLPSNASKECSGTHEELGQRAMRLERAAERIVSMHQSQDHSGSDGNLDERRRKRVQALQREAARTREFLSQAPKRLNSQGQEIKTNVTDPESGKMATGKGVIQGYAAQAAVDGDHQIIVAADIVGSVAEHGMLLPMIEQADAYCQDHTLVLADAGYHTKDNVEQLEARGIPALIADKQMRKRDARLANQDRFKPKDDVLYDKTPKAHKLTGKERFRPRDFDFRNDGTCLCPAGKTLVSNGSTYLVDKGLHRQDYKASADDCGPCELRSKCLRYPERTPARKVYLFGERSPDWVEPKGVVERDDAITRMRTAIDSPEGRRRYGRRIGTVEPVFGNLRHNKRLARFNLRGRGKVNTQWHLYCMVHNIEKLAGSGWRA